MAGKYGSDRHQNRGAVGHQVCRAQNFLVAVISEIYSLIAAEMLVQLQIREYFFRDNVEL